MWILLLLLLLFGIWVNGFDENVDNGIVVDLENFLQISSQNQQIEEILARQKRQNELELVEIVGTLTPLEKQIEKPNPLVEGGNEIGLELVEMERNISAGRELATENIDDDDDDLLTMIWRNDWIWRKEMGGNETDLMDGRNETNYEYNKMELMMNTTESMTTTTTKKKTTTPFWRKRIHKKGNKYFKPVNFNSKATVWPIDWLNLPMPTNFPQSTLHIVEFSTTNQPKTTMKTIKKQLCCPPGGLWSNWTQIGQCNDNCGGCGQQHFQRECLSSIWGCPCVGESKVQRECAFAPCPFPRLSCCNGRKINSSGEGRHVNCGPPPDPPANSQSSLPDCLCCPNGGVWGEWKAVDECSDSCGSCGTQQFNRECISMAWGCPCSGPVILKLVCNQRPCIFPRLSCCNRLKLKASANRTLICGPEVFQLVGLKVKMPTESGRGNLLNCN